MAKQKKNPGGRPRKTAEQLKASGSWRAKARANEGKKAPKPRAPRTPTWKPLTKRQLANLILTIPGYNPRRGATGCRFDDKAANRALEFFETQLRHVEGAVAGKPFKLEPWQQAIVANLFGWLRKDDQGRTVRRYREALIYVPRKNGKSPLAAGIALYGLFKDGEAGAQIILAAAKRDQAALLFRHCRGMVERCPSLTDASQIFGGVGQRSIVLRQDSASSLRVISSEAGGEHGGNVSLAIVDELHAQPNRDLVDVISTSMASANRAQPLLVFITTSDFARESICNEKHGYAEKVRDGILDDPAFLPVIYEAPRDADWKSPDVWAAANPNIGVSVSREYLERECKHAQEVATFENTFRRLHLNQKTETDMRWLPMDRWDQCGAEDPIAWRAEAFEELQDLVCMAGLDLSTSIDVTAFVLDFRRGPNHIVLPFFWVPEENARKREQRDRVPYQVWARQGFLTQTPGAVVDYDRVRADICALGKKFNIRKIARDRWNASQITTQLMGDGFNVVDCGQGFASLSAPSKELEKIIIGGTIEHGSNPMLRWMASNAAAETDAAGNIKPSKAKSTERIDGIAALVMALAAWGEDSGQVPTGTFYEDNDLEIF
ncbi:MAG TPA: terminase TerL endonuclease subunit [Pirellulales bacterium]|jgi:phage terminase large subunit-like protein